MAGYAQSETIDADYSDVPADPSIQLHQLYHQQIAHLINQLDKDATPQAGYVWAYDGGTSLYVPRALLSTDIPALVTDTQTGTTYTLALTDAGSGVTFGNASPTTLTIPANGTVAFPVGTVITGQQLGAGQVTVAPAGTVTLNSSGGATKTANQFSVFGLWKTAVNTWTLYGDIST